MPNVKDLELLIDRMIRGTTTDRNRLTPIFIGEHVCAIHEKGCSFWGGIGRRAYAPTQIRLYEFHRNLGNERGEVYVALHPDGAKLTKKLTQAAIEKAKYFDLHYLEVLADKKKKEDERQAQEEAKVKWAELFAEGIGIQSDYSHCSNHLDEEYLQYTLNVKVGKGIQAVVKSDKAELTIDITLGIDVKKNPKVTIHISGLHGHLESIFHDSPPNEIRKWFKEMGVEL
jgi:hypothetical protein